MLMTSEPFFVMVLKEAHGIKSNLFFFYSYLWQWPLNKDQMQLKVKLHFITCSGKKKFSWFSSMFSCIEDELQRKLQRA